MFLLADYTQAQVDKIVKNTTKSVLETVLDKMGAAFLWTTVAVVGLFLLGGLIVYLTRRDKLASYGKTSLLLGVGFAVAVAVSGLALTITKYSIRGSLVTTILYPLTAAACAAIAGGFALYVVNSVAKDKLKLATWIVVGLVAVPLVVGLVYMGIYYADNIKSDGYYDGGDASVSTGALVGSAVGLVALACLVALLFGKKGDKREHTRAIAYAGVSVALAFALSYVKIFRMPQGGSVTLASMLPIMLYSCRYGTRKGLLVGLVYGTLQALQDPYIIHPAQFLLDYPIAFAMLGLAGWAGEVKWFGKYKGVALLIGCISAFFMRYIAHVLSGIFAFSAYAFDAGYASATVYSFLYNTYVLVDGAICVALGVMMFANKGVRKLLLPVAPPEASAQTPVEQAANADEWAEPAPQDQPDEVVND